MYFKIKRGELELRECYTMKRLWGRLQLLIIIVRHSKAFSSGSQHVIFRILAESGERNVWAIGSLSAYPA